MRSIDFTGWMLLLSGWLAWTMDGYDVSRDFRSGRWLDRSLMVVADEIALGWDE
jgi:hypothetical protein